MSQDNNWQQQVWQQPAAPQQPIPQSAPYGYAVQQPPKKSRGWIVALVAVVLVFALLALGMWSCTSVMSSSFGSFGASAATDDVDYLTGDAVGVIDIDGTIQYDGTTSSPEGLKAQLDRAEKNSHIKAIVLRVNSGGGTATAGEEIRRLYVRYPSSRRGVNASMRHHLWLSHCQADYRGQTTAIGAIASCGLPTVGLHEAGHLVDGVASADDSGALCARSGSTSYRDQWAQNQRTIHPNRVEGRDIRREGDNRRSHSPA